MIELALAALLAAQQADASRNCGDDWNEEACAAIRARRLGDLYGVEPIEAHRDRGDQVRRVAYVDGYGSDVVMISFVRARGHDPEVRVHFPIRRNRARLDPLIGLVGANLWDEVIRRSTHFDRTLSAPIEPPSSGNDDAISICLHGWTFTVEATDPPTQEGARPTVRHRTENACENGLTEDYGVELYMSAVPLFPHCDLLDRASHRNGAAVLAACGLLTGDRAAAAEAMNSADALRYIDGADDAASLRAQFAYEAVVDWNGERNQGAYSAARFWATKAAEGGRSIFYFERVHGESADRVRLTGFLARWREVAGESERVYERAQVEQIWRRDGRTFEIERAVVGPFRPVPQER